MAINDRLQSGRFAPHFECFQRQDGDLVSVSRQIPETGNILKLNSGSKLNPDQELIEHAVQISVLGTTKSLANVNPRALFGR